MRHAKESFSDRRLLTSGATSLGLHCSLLLLLVLVVVPVQRAVFVQTEVRLTEPDYGAEFVMLDVALPEVNDESPRMVDLAGTMSQASLDIQSPVAEVAAADGTGSHHTDAGTSSNDGGSGERRASFFGTQAEGDHFVYVLDVSGSMGNGGGRRYRRAADELLRSIEQLNKDQYFHVLLFSSQTLPMFDQSERELKMAPATAENKQHLAEWIKGVVPQGGTHPQDALRLALELRPSAVFFLSDGAFSRAAVGRSRQHVMKHVMKSIEKGTAQNYRLLEPRDVVQIANPNAIPVHAVAFEDPKSAKDMFEISELTGGEYRFVGVSESEPTEREERTAQRWLRAAQRLERHGNLSQAKLGFAKVLRQFPHTDAAGEIRDCQPELYAAEQARRRKYAP